MAIYEPPNNYFNNINFNNDFYTIPNDELNGISSAYADTHYLQIGGGTTPKSSALYTIFSGGVGIGVTVSTGTGYLDVGNIVCKNNIVGKNIYTNSNFYENNIPLTDKYQSNLLASKIDYNRQYPPLSLYSVAWNVAGQVYGNGIYISTASSVYFLASAFGAFNYPSSAMTYFQVNTSNYTGTSGAYAGSVTTVINIVGVPTNYYGEWLQLQLPLNITIKSYSITGFTSGGVTKNPSAWYLIGSFDGVNWVIVDTRSSITSWSSANPASVFNYVPNGDTSQPALYYRLIITASNGSTTVGIQNLVFYANDGTALTASISSYGIGIGTTSLTHPIAFYNTNQTQLMGGVGIGTSPDPTGNYSFDILTANGVRIKSSPTFGYLAYTGANSTTTLGSMKFFDGAQTNCGWVGLGSITTNYIDMAVASSYVGYSTNGKLLVSTGNSPNAGATFDVGGTSTSYYYSYFNGLRLSGVDTFNSIYQTFAASNIGLTTAGTSSYIMFNIGSGNIIGQISSNGFALNTNKGIGLGVNPPASNAISILPPASSAGIILNGTSPRIGMNNDLINIGYASAANAYSTGAAANDCIIRNTGGNILLLLGVNYPNVKITGTATYFLNSTTGVNCAVIDNTGTVAATSFSASSSITGQSLSITGGGATINGGATFNNSITITGGTIGLSDTYNAAGGSLTGNSVTGVPVGYMYWGGGNNSTVVAYTCPGNTGYSIKAANAIIGAGFISSSDKRIKRDIKSIDNSLEIIEKIEPKNYNITETAANKYGFIAQEVEEIIPNTVNIGDDFIPNIFDYADYNDKIITFDNKNDLVIVEGDEVKINYEICRVEEVIDKNSFRIHKKLKPDDKNKVFIIGTKVYDFKCIDYNSITSINTAAIKELYKIIQRQQEQIELLMSKIS